MSEVKNLPISLIDSDPNQARKYFDPNGMHALSESVDAGRGVSEPIVVRPVGERYLIVSGERRFKAARLAGHKSIAAIVRELDDREAARAGLLANFHREDLNPYEETVGVINYACVSFNVGFEDCVRLFKSSRNLQRRGSPSAQVKACEALIEEMLGKGLEYFFRHRLPLLELEPPMLQALQEGEIEYSKLQRIMAVKDEAMRHEIFAEALRNGLSRSQITALIRKRMKKKRGGEKVASPLPQGTLSARQVSKHHFHPTVEARLDRLLAHIHSLNGDEMFKDDRNDQLCQHLEKVLELLGASTAELPENRPSSDRNP